MVVIVIKKKIISIFCALMVCVGCLGSPAYATSDARLFTDLQQMPKEFWKALQGAWDGLQSDKGACPNCGNTDISSSLLGCPECGASGWVTYNGKDTEIDLGSLFGGGGSSGVGAGRDSIRFATPVIGPRGYKRIYVPVSYDENYLSVTYAVTANEDAFIYSLPAHYGTLSSSNQYFCITHNSTSAYASGVFWGKSVVVDADGVYQTGLEIELLAGNIQLDRGSAARVYDVGAKLQYYGSKSSVRAGGSTRSYNNQVNLVRHEVSTTFYKGALIRGRYFVELVADLYGTPIDYTVVTNNNYINVENKTITVNNQEINYNNAYYENNVYYVYTNDEKVTTYITNDNGDIIGECTYNPDTGSYTIKLYNYEPPKSTATPAPTATPSPAPTASPAPTEAPSATDAPDNGGSGGDNSGSNGSNGGDNSGGADSDNSGSSGGGFWDKLLQDLWDRLFGGLIDGLVAILDGILQMLLKLLGSIFSVLPLFTALLGLVFPFVPSAILGIVSTGLFLAVILGVVKFIRGFF